MDNYGWKGSCRATYFIPNQKSNKIVIYERISAGIGPGGFVKKKCFFIMNQGIPGRAWANAWAGQDGNEYLSLIESIQIGVVPEKILKKETETRTFFKDNSGITDNDIYESLGEKKKAIKSYMAVGILGRYNALIGVLAIDSDEPNIFSDFELLKNNRAGDTFMQESGMAVFGKGEGDFCDFPSLFKHAPSLKDLRKQVPVTQEWKETTENIKRVGVFMHAMQAKKVSIQAPAFLFALAWVLKQIRDIFLMDSN